MLVAIFQRLVAMPEKPRFLVLTTWGLANFAFDPAHSELGNLQEGLLVVGALLIGELLGHPFELRRRLTFAREAEATGRLPKAAPNVDAAVHPLTLCFANDALERAYAARAFGESYSVVVAFCLALPALLGMLVVAMQTSGLVFAALAAGMSVLIGVRAWLHHSPDQA
jgi:hypothetical protein